MRKSARALSRGARQALPAPQPRAGTTGRGRPPARLSHSLLLLRSIIENIPDMIFVKDAARLRFVMFNKAGEDLLGYARADLIGKSDYDFFTRAEADHFTRMDREVLRSGALFDIPEEPIHTRSKGIRILHTKKIPILDGAGRPRYLLGISEDITEKRNLERQVIEAGERERQRLGQEVHDGLGQQLAGIAFMSEALATALTDKGLPEAEEAARMARSASEAVTHSRDLARLLYPVELEALGLASALHELASHTSKVFRIACEFACPAPVPRLAAGVEGHLFRIAQESVANAVRHSRGRRILIQLAGGDGRLILTVEDDGHGLPAKRTSSRGMGLAILRYRARVIHGRLEMARSALGGARVSCSVPCRPAGGRR